MTPKEIHEAMFDCDSYSRLGTLLELFRSQKITHTQCLKTLGQIWESCDNIATYKTALCFLLPFDEDGPVKEMMSTAELKAYSALPEEFTVYRGCYEHNKDGFSWSLDRKLAQGFPLLNRYLQAGQPLLLTARIPKHVVMAVKLDRGESEVIAWVYGNDCCDITDEEPISHIEADVTQMTH